MLLSVCGFPHPQQRWTFPLWVFSSSDALWQKLLALKPKSGLSPFGDVIEGLCQIIYASQAIVVIRETSNALRILHMVHPWQETIPFGKLDFAL